MYRKLVFVLTMFAVAFGSLSGAQAALASPHQPARVASAAHASTAASIAPHSAKGAVRAAAARRPMAHGAHLRTQEKQGSLSLGRGRRATETASAPTIISAPSLTTPKITSPAAATFTVGKAGTFTVTTTGSPTPDLSATGGALPSGVTFKDNNNGTATLAGTPAPGTARTYTFTITAKVPFFVTDTQSFTLTVNQACKITSPAVATFTTNVAGTFTVTSTGPPTCALSATGLPPGISFTDNTDGTGTISGTSTTAGTYAFTITATNVAGSDTQNFILTVAGGDPAPCKVTSPAAATFTVGQAGTFTVTTSGNPLCQLSETGTLPSGVTFNSGDGTATLSGTPAAGTGGTYTFTITATNTAGYDTQSFTFTVNHACRITSAPPTATTLTVGFAWTYTTVTSDGVPTCTVDATGLPPGITLTDNKDGTGTFSGNPTAAGTYPVTITAKNVAGSDTQTFTLTVNPAQACKITSADHITFTVGQSGTFKVTSTGVPGCTLSETGSLPSGVTFTDNGDGTATLSGTPDAGTGDPYPFTITATNGVSPDATQNFTLSVLMACKIASDGYDTFHVGLLGTFTVNSPGTPGCTLSETGALPSGVTFTPNVDGTATLSGIPDPGTGGTYPFTITATNGVSPDATQNFTLTVNQACKITTGDNATFDVGQSGTFKVRSTGWPRCTLSEPRTPPSAVTFSTNLPKGVRFTVDRDDTAIISGTPAAGTVGAYLLKITATNDNGSDSQYLHLTVLQPPTITSADHTTCIVGQACAFTVKSTGSPTPYLSAGVPSGFTFTDNLDGTATLSGRPAASGPGNTYTFTITATNTRTPDATQTFTLTVVGTPAAPSGLKATRNGATVSLTWTNHAAAPSAATAIWIQRSTNFDFKTPVTNIQVGPTATSYVDRTAPGPTYYYYRVRAYNVYGYSSWSDPASP